MPIPPFIVELRRHVGQSPLWLIGTTAVVIDAGKVLLVKRSDNGQWTPVTGIVDPGENPAQTASREVLEETGVTAEPLRLAWLHTTAAMVHANGDQAQYLDHVFAMQYVGGEPYAADEESTAAQWFPLTDMPPMPAHMRRRITAVLADRAETSFDEDDFG